MPDTDRHGAAAATADLVVRGARTHNLKNVTLSLPTGKLIVITGVSGSGKSSLAFDTIYAEGQRRYVESLSAYARQFLERMEKPDVDGIDNISPSIAIRQKNSVRNPRSTVGTVTEIHDYMRLLFARVGKTICHQCGQEVVRETAEVVADRLLRLPEGTRLLIGYDLPLVDLKNAPADDAAEPGEEELPFGTGPAAGGAAAVAAAPLSELETLRRKGFGRVLLDGQTISIDDLPPDALKGRSVIGVVVDRLRIEGDLRSRLTDSIETSYHESGGAAWAVEVTGDGAPAQRHEFSERFECRTCGITYEDPQPRLFSFNNPFGACPTCHGFGNIVELDLNLVVPEIGRAHV